MVFDKALGVVRLAGEIKLTRAKDGDDNENEGIPLTGNDASIRYGSTRNSAGEDESVISKSYDVVSDRDADNKKDLEENRRYDDTSDNSCDDDSETSQNNNNDDKDPLEFTSTSSAIRQEVGPSNTMLSVRDCEFLRRIGRESAELYPMVPPMDEDNMALVLDDNILFEQRMHVHGINNNHHHSQTIRYHHRGGGKLYYAEQSFYNKDQRPLYVLTISPHIYRHILTELHQSRSIPYGMYFCCQGGEFGAHSGAAHDHDVVDISLARTLLALLFVTMMILSVTLPPLEERLQERQEEF